ncbi:MAG: chorismate synthase [Lachnospiraceae bacterium]|nr:chorismate synthase [Lachnospiraceae bacterium]
MAGSTFGKLFRVTTWGESHGKGIGVVVDGCPAGLPLSEADIQPFLDRRKPGQNRYTTQRSEGDLVEILSGVFEGKTTGTPISLLIRNTDQRSHDYSEIAGYYRPGHADVTFDAKYGFRDYRGGGRSSGRETAGRVAGGAIALKALAALGITVEAWTSSIGPVSCDPKVFDREHLAVSRFSMPDPAAEEQAAAYLEECLRSQTSSGGCASCRITGLPAGIGEPVFDKLDAVLGQALFSIGAVKALEIGDGCRVSTAVGHENNDNWDENGFVSNHAGGILGGMSSGQDILLKVHFKPTPSIAREQTALFRDGHVDTVSIHGRHDPLITARAVVVVESMCALTVLDLLMQNAVSTMDKLKKTME